MKDLGAKLLRTLGHQASTKPSVNAGSDAQASTLAERLQAMSRHGGEGLTLEALPGAREVPTPFGSCFTVSTLFPHETHHGSLTLGAALNGVTNHLVRLVGDDRLEGFDPRRALYLDIEATGLDHGAGTCAFLVGLGFFDAGAFRVDQLFLRTFEEEMALLHLLKERIDAFPYLVSFNGKSYDLTVLQTRLVIQRVYSRDECELKLHPHLDLLHLSRNLYKGAWDNTRLQTLEAQLLGFARQDDIPGSLVPSMWYHFLRTGEIAPVEAVLQHNLWDVLSMVTLTTAVTRDGLPHRNTSDAALVNVSNLLLRRGHPAAAIEALETRDRARLEAPLQRRALWIHAEAARRLARWELHIAMLEELVKNAPSDVEGWIALAKAQEHRLKDLDAAYDSALKAWEISREPAIEKRLRRLERKLSQYAQ